MFNCKKSRLVRSKLILQYEREIILPAKKTLAQLDKYIKETESKLSSGLEPQIIENSFGNSVTNNQSKLRSKNSNLLISEVQLVIKKGEYSLECAIDVTDNDLKTYDNFEWCILCILRLLLQMIGIT
jgi:hypothetical protein